MYKSLTQTKKYSELKAYETLNRVASANAILKHYKSSFLITVKRHAMVLSFFKKLTLSQNMPYYCFFDLILYVPSTIFQLNRGGYSWVEPVLS